MDLKTARKVCAEMEKNLGGKYLAALTTLGAHLSFISDITKRGKFKAPGIAGPEIIKDLHEAWPETDCPAPFDMTQVLATLREGSQNRQQRRAK